MPQHPFTTGRWFTNVDHIENLSSKWFLNKNSNDSIKSFAFIPNKDVSCMFLGTFPIWEISEGNERHGDLEFFYGSKDNQFWKVLTSITDSKINDEEDCIKLLSKYNLGISDIVLETERNPHNGNLDKNLFPVLYNSIMDIKLHYPNLKNIFLTSGGSGSINNLNDNNKSTATFLKDSIYELNPIGFNQVGGVKNVIIQNHNFNLIMLFSPSPSANVAIQGILNRNNNFGIINLSVDKFRKIQWLYLLNKYCGISKDEINNKLNNIFSKHPELKIYLDS